MQQLFFKKTYRTFALSNFVYKKHIHNKLKKIKRRVSYFCFFLATSMLVAIIAIITPTVTPMISMFEFGVDTIALSVGLVLSIVLSG